MDQRTAKLFMNGRSQAVRLPKEFRIPGTEARIRKEGNAVVLEPIERPGWPAGFWQDMDRQRKKVDLESLQRPPDPLPPLWPMPPE